jgi:DNA-binding MarR family transcriptional regulator
MSAPRPRYRLTDKEAAIIRVIGRDVEATSHQLVAATRSMMSEVKVMLSRLQERGFVTLTEDKGLANLTDEGQHLFHLLERPQQKMYTQSNVSPDVWIVPDAAMVEGSQDEEYPDLDAALEETLRRLQD